MGGWVGGREGGREGGGEGGREGGREEGGGHHILLQALMGIPHGLHHLFYLTNSADKDAQQYGTAALAQVAEKAKDRRAFVQQGGLRKLIHLVHLVTRASRDQLQ